MSEIDPLSRKTDTTREMIQRAKRTVHALRVAKEQPNLANQIAALAARLESVAYDDAWVAVVGDEMIGPYLEQNRAVGLAERLAYTRTKENGGIPVNWGVCPIRTRSARG